MDKQKCLLIEHKHLSLQQSLITLHYSPGTILAGWQKDTKLLSINVGEKTWQIIRPGRNIEKVGFFLFLLAFQWLIVFDRVGKCREGEWNHFTTIFKIDFCFVPTQNCHLNYDNKEINSDMKYKEKWKISLKLKKKNTICLLVLTTDIPSLPLRRRRTVLNTYFRWIKPIIF